MKKKITKVMVLALSISMLQSFVSFAGQWKQNETGWWYENDDGTYPTNTWQWLDGNNDGIAECYYFDSNGYCLLNTTTPDGCMVNADGAWIENGEVKTQGASQPTEPASSTGATASAGHLNKKKPPLKLQTDFIKQEFIDVLGEDMDYGLQRLAAYNPTVYEGGFLGTSIFCSVGEFGGVSIYYIDNAAWYIYSLGWGLLDAEENVEYNFIDKFGENVVRLDEDRFRWILSESPYVEIVYDREFGATFTLKYIEK